MNLYNEIEPFAAEWLRNLSNAGHIARGVVDARSIADLTPADLAGFRQFHTFAGIGVWSYALRLAGWPDDVPVWTGSCPCQPFSAAGKRGGFDDERHLWPEWFRLIQQCRPPVIFGEQVASPDGLKWFDAVSADLEREGYAVGAADLCAAGVGAPHIRQRLYFAAVRLDHHHQGLERHPGNGDGRSGRSLEVGPVTAAGAVGELGDPGSTRGRWDAGAIPSAQGESPEERFGARRLPDELITPGATNGFWSPAEWWICRDGKARPAQPGAFPLVARTAGRVGLLRAYGNAIVPQVAATFIRAVMGW